VTVRLPPLALLAGAWLLGIVAGAATGAVWWPAAGAIAAAGFVTSLLERRWQIALLGLLATVAFVGGAWRYAGQPVPRQPAGIALHNGGAAVRLRGLVTDDPTAAGRTQKVRVAVQAEFANGGWKRASGGVLVETGLFPRYRYGDIVDVNGKLKAPMPVGSFDYGEYLARHGIQSMASYPSVHAIDHGKGTPLLQVLHSVRKRLSDALGRALPEPQAALAQGILLGQRASIPQQLTDEMNATGTSHLVAISGQNVSLVAALIIAALAWLIGRRRAALVALFAIAGYTALTGATPSVVRGAIMGELFVLATLLGRPTSASTSIALAAAIMTGLDPQVVHDVSFQLSFAAIVGLVYLAPSLRAQGAAFLRQMGIEAEGGLAGALLESLSVTAGAVLTTAPLIALQFGRVSLIAPLPNLLLVWEYPLIVVSGTLTALATLAWAPLGEVTGWFSWLTLTYMIETVRFFARLPLASMEVRGFGRWHAAIMYAAIAAFAWWLARRPREPKSRTQPSSAPLTVHPRWLVAAVLAIVASCFWWAALQGEARGRLSVDVLDVGQGDAILITTPDGRHVLVDGGASGLTLEQRLGEELPFWERTIDMVALTHPQQDHISGLIDVLQRYNVREVLATSIVATTAVYQEWRSLIADGHIAYHEATAGESIDLGGGASMHVLGPSAESFTSAQMNDTSLVLKVSWDNVSFLLTGDIQAFGEGALLDSRADLHATALKVPHHGSSTSSSAAFLDAVQPQVAVVSIGANNPYHHPSADVIERLQADGSLVLRTDQAGTVSMSTDGEHLWIDTQRAP
jgi:competence protein ComEC